MAVCPRIGQETSGASFKGEAMPTLRDLFPPKKSGTMSTEHVAKLIRGFEGVVAVTAEAPEIDREDGGVFPATVSIAISADAFGIHILEFIAWALGDMRRAGANVHFILRSPPPWLNTPGRSMRLDVYVNPRTQDLADAEALAQVNAEVEEMTKFLDWAYKEHWPACRPLRGKAGA